MYRMWRSATCRGGIWTNIVHIKEWALGTKKESDNVGAIEQDNVVADHRIPSKNKLRERANNSPGQYG